MWNLKCLLCDEQPFKSLTKVQEHVMTIHGYSQADLRQQNKSPDNMTSDHYVYSMPDGTPWLEATKSQ